MIIINRESLTLDKVKAQLYATPSKNGFYQVNIGKFYLHLYALPPSDKPFNAVALSDAVGCSADLFLKDNNSNHTKTITYKDNIIPPQYELLNVLTIDDICDLILYLDKLEKLLAFV